MYKEEDMFNAAMDLGAKAYILKENAANDVVAALEKVDGGETFSSASMLEDSRDTRLEFCREDHCLARPAHYSQAIPSVTEPQPCEIT